ncbi:MAG: pseudouridine synthase [Proteobacteria bacterium]|nr:pseudouridine synthase [Pseudomonadota bacterium]
MSSVILFNKPFNVLSQFTDSQGRDNLSHYIKLAGYYPAGRLDYDSEGLMVFTNDGKTQQQISDPSSKVDKVYLLQVEGIPHKRQLDKLRKGIRLKDNNKNDYVAIAKKIQILANKPAFVMKRQPPIRQRKKIPVNWLELTIDQGKNRQLRKMLAAVNLPVLRLVRIKIGSWDLDSIEVGSYKKVDFM